MFLLKNKKTLKCFLQLWVRHRNRNSADIKSVIFSCHLKAGSDDDAMTSGGKPFQIRAAPTRKIVTDGDATPWCTEFPASTSM